MERYIKYKVKAGLKIVGAFLFVGFLASCSSYKVLNIDVLHPGELCQGFDVSILEAFRCGIGRGDAQSFGACNGADDSDMPTSFVFEVIEGGGHHAGESFYVGTGGI